MSFDSTIGAKAAQVTPLEAVSIETAKELALPQTQCQFRGPETGHAGHSTQEIATPAAQAKKYSPPPKLTPKKHRVLVNADKVQKNEPKGPPSTGTARNLRAEQPSHDLQVQVRFQPPPVKELSLRRSKRIDPKSKPSNRTEKNAQNVQRIKSRIPVSKSSSKGRPLRAEKRTTSAEKRIALRRMDRTPKMQAKERTKNNSITLEVIRPQEKGKSVEKKSVQPKVQQPLLQAPPLKKIENEPSFESIAATERSNKPFNQEELRSLTLVNKFIEAKSGKGHFIPNAEEKRAIAALFHKAIANPEVNKQMLEMLKNKDSNLSPDTIDVFVQLSYRTRAIANLPNIMKKAEANLEKIHANTPISEDEKLSLEEMSALYNFGRIGHVFAFIKNDILGDQTGVQDPKMEDLNKVCQCGRKADILMKQIHLKLDRHSSYKAGDLVFMNINKHRKAREEKVSFTQKLKTFFLGMPLLHAAVCVKKNEEGENQDRLSHMQRNYFNNDFSLFDKMVSSGFRLDPKALLNQEGPKANSMRTFLTEMFQDKGQSLENGLSGLYENIQNSMHAEDRFDPWTNPHKHELKTGLSHVFSALHKKTAEPDQFKSVHQDFFGEGKLEEHKVICSEFATRSMLAGLMEAEIQLKEQMINFLVQKKGIDPTQAKQFVENLEIFNLPFSQTENLSYVTPSRLLEVLAEKECLQRVPTDPLIQKMVKAADLSLDPSEQVINGRDIPPVPAANVAPIVLEESAEAKELNDAKEPRPHPTLMQKWEPTSREKYSEGNVTDSIFYVKIAQVRTFISKLKVEWKKKLEQLPYSLTVDTAKRLLRDAEKSGEIKNRFTPTKEGAGAAYFLSDAAGQKQYVIKPSGEGSLELNNQKNRASPETGERVTDRMRQGIPLYNGPQTEALAYKMAEDSGFAHVTPKTRLAMIKSSQFNDVMDNVTLQESEKLEEVLEKTGKADKEKLCSVQTFVPGLKDLAVFLDEVDEKTEKEALIPIQRDELLSSLIDQQDVMDCVLFSCLIGETDGNTSNYGLYPKKDQDGNTIYGMMKLDNEMAFSERNGEGRIELLHALPNMMGMKISQERKAQILDKMNDAWVDKESARMRFYGKSEAAVASFVKRVTVMRSLAESEATLGEFIAGAKRSSTSAKRVLFNEAAASQEKPESPRAPMAGTTLYTEAAPLETPRHSESKKEEALKSPRSQNTEGSDKPKLVRTGHINPAEIQEEMKEENERENIKYIERQRNSNPSKPFV